ncbi:MAG: lysophospholipid acyltransferase family protein [Acidimicrobiales bacterium]
MATDDVGKLYPVAKAILTPLFRLSWRFDLQGAENVPATGGAILCPNHTSVLDSFFVPALLPRRVTYVGKAEYMDSWKTKHIFPALGMIPIDREGGDAAERALSAAERCCAAASSSASTPRARAAATDASTEATPARHAWRCGPRSPSSRSASPARDVMPPDARFPKLRMPVTIRFGRPISVARYADRAGDHLVLRQIIDEVMYEIRELSGQEYVNEYANKKKSAPATAAPAAEAPLRPAGGAEALAAAGSNGNGQHPTPAPPAEAPVPAEVAATAASADGDGPLEGGEFTRATEPRSSADLLRRPVRRAG